MRSVPFKMAHFSAFEVQAAQRRENVTPHEMALLATRGDARTIMDGGRVIGVGGVVRAGEVAAVWCLLSERIGAHRFVALHRLVRRYLAEIDADQIITSVSPGFRQGFRWAAMLGFRETGIAPEDGTHTFRLERAE